MGARSGIGAWLRAGRLAGSVKVGALAATVAVVPVAVVVASAGDDVERAEIAVAAVDATDQAGAGGGSTTTATADDSPGSGTEIDPMRPGVPVVGDKPGPTTTTEGPTTTRPAGPTTTTTHAAGTTATVDPGGATTTTRPGATTTRPPTPTTLPGPEPTTTTTTRGTTTTTRAGTTTTTTRPAPPTTTTTSTTTTTTTAPPTTTTTTTTAPPPTARTPRLVGLPHGEAVEEARDAQRALGYSATTEAADCAGNTEPSRFGIVFEQSPAPDAPLAPGTPITLRYYDTCTIVPDVVGLTIEGADGVLRRFGLQRAASTTCGVRAPEYTVVAQDPGPGPIVRQGTTVAIVINQGPCSWLE